MCCSTGEKQAIFNNQIVPLMQQVVDLCDAHGIALVASFGLDILPDHTDRVHGSWVLLGGKFAGSKRLNLCGGILLKAKSENPDTEIALRKGERDDDDGEEW